MADTIMSRAIEIGLEEGTPAEEKVTIRSAEGDIIIIPLSAAKESNTIKNMLGVLGEKSEIIPIAQPTRWLCLVFEFCCILSRNHDKLTDFSRKCDSQVVAWQNEFLEKHAMMARKPSSPLLVATNNSSEVLVLLLANANFLDVPQLMSLCAFTIAMCLYGQTVEYMRAFFRITDPGFTKEEEAEVIKENDWLLPDD